MKEEERRLTHEKIGYSPEENITHLESQQRQHDMAGSKESRPEEAEHGEQWTCILRQDNFEKYVVKCGSVAFVPHSLPSAHQGMQSI